MDSLKLINHLSELRLNLGLVVFSLLIQFAVGQKLQASGEVSDLNHKCGFPVVLQAHASGKFDLYQKFYDNKIQQSTLDSVYFSPSGHFKIYYTTDGPDSISSADRNGNGTADYLEFVAEAFDRAWQIEIDSLGFLPPPDSSGNVRNIYPVSCKRLSVYGVTYLDWQIPELPGDNYVTSIEINTRFNFVNYPGISDPLVRDSMAVAVTAAHEFNHALQCGYRLWPDGNNFFYDLWFIESSATFMEEVVAPQVNDYLYYLDDYFRRTHRPFDESTGFLSDYGKVVLPIMLGYLYEDRLIRYVWEGILDRRALPALEVVLQDFDTDFANELDRLAIWLYYIRERSIPNMYFPDAPLFPELSFVFSNSIREPRSILVNDSLPRFSFQWYLSEATVSQNLQIKLEIDDQSKQDFLISKLVNPVSKEYYLVFPEEIIDLPFRISSPDFPFVIINTDSSVSDYSPYKFIVDVKSIPMIANAVVYPQPFRMSDRFPFLSFGNLPAGTTLTIFNSNGLLVRQLYADNDNIPIRWDLKNDLGKQVGSGVYLFHVEKSDERKIGKFVIVK
jgi:hypothetical protein